MSSEIATTERAISRCRVIDDITIFSETNFAVLFGGARGDDRLVLQSG
jgi:hypothetical protein